MSFLDGITDNYGGIATSVVSIAALAFLSKQMQANTTPQNNTTSITVTASLPSTTQLQPSAENKIPVLYGASWFGGVITDAVMTNNNQTMTYCITLSEKTGTILSTSQASAYTFHDVYYNSQRLIFKSDGYTVDYSLDINGVVDKSLSGFVKIYCYAGNSSSSAPIGNYDNPNVSAISVMPGWTSTNTMDDLIFAIVEVDYNQANGITSIGSLLFNIQNSMKLPGDVLYDYMTNTRYGAGLDPSVIKT